MQLAGIALAKPERFPGSRNAVAFDSHHTLN